MPATPSSPATRGVTETAPGIPAGHYDLDVLASDLLASVRKRPASAPLPVVGASLGGMTVLGAHRLAPADLWAAVVLVDITPRMEFDGHAVVSFMAAHPDGFATLDEAAEVIAEWPAPRGRAVWTDSARCYVSAQDTDGWIAGPGGLSSNFGFLRRRSATGAEEFSAITDLLVDGARRVQAPTLLLLRRALRRRISAVGR